MQSVPNLRLRWVPVGCMQSTPDPAQEKVVSGVDHQEALLLEVEDAELPNLLCAWVW